MKRRAKAVLTVVLWSLLGFMALTCIKPPGGRFDFNLRMNEIACVLKGVNPFKVWSEEIDLPPYVSNLPKKPVPEGCTEQVNAYAPWEYAYMMPLALLPRSQAWLVYCFLMGVSVLSVLFFPMSNQKNIFSAENRFLASAIPLIAVSYLLWSNTSVGNFIIFVLACAVLMACALTHGRWLMAGILWALAMIKPQSAVLFAVPLLFRGKLLTCIIAGTVCAVSSLLPAVLCRTSVYDLMLQGPAANAELFNGCGTWPKFLCGYFSNDVDIAIGLVIGAVLCLWMTWLLRREKDWLVFLMPAAVCSSCWTYTQAYSHAMGWFLAYAVVKELIGNPHSKAMRILSALSLLVLPRFILAWHGLYAYMGWRFPMSEFVYRSVDSLNSTCTLVLALSFCLIKHRRDCKV